MPLRRHWDELPTSLRREVERRTGVIVRADSVPEGAACEVAVTLQTPTGRVFCKGGRAESRQGWLYRREARINPWLPEEAPRLRWAVEHGGWLLLGFDHVPGRHPCLEPGSPDLKLVADLLATLARELTPCPPIDVQPFTERWRGLIAPELVDGDTLLHTDMTPRNFLLGDRLRLVDWSAPCRGAAWIDTAFMLVRLVRAGHDPAAAEQWAAEVPAFAQADDEAVTAFTDALVRLWDRAQRTSPAPHRGPLLDAARRWRAHRLSRRRPAG
ncbi:hypothetical protein C1I95_07280 [Micromonospora craterilacus]|uniref:Aminoglycoside phosphotransferase n=1 Tax=Micromonospora craterilacus TaxID=1655439 RepID=A0A2W2FIC3_9ACTN|nr:hypothetical protein [Micromonospora craterilacus]PZG21457.1 hypothetical protein C1I95_07280 [Micromonospora craterilacus]